MLVQVKSLRPKKVKYLSENMTCYSGRWLQKFFINLYFLNLLNQ